MRFCKLAILVFGLVLSGYSGAVPIKLHIDHLDSNKEIYDRDGWDGDLVCTWKGRDLHVTFSNPSYPRLLALKVPTLKSLLKNKIVDVDLDARLGELSLTTDSRVHLSMVNGSQCAVTATNEDATQVALSIHCDGLQDDKFGFVSSLDIHSPGLACPKP